MSYDPKPLVDFCTQYEVPLYLWRIKLVLKRCKVPKHYDQDWSLFGSLSEKCPYSDIWG